MSEIARQLERKPLIQVFIICGAVGFAVGILWLLFMLLTATMHPQPVNLVLLVFARVTCPALAVSDALKLDSVYSLPAWNSLCYAAVGLIVRSVWTRPKPSV